MENGSNEAKGNPRKIPLSEKALGLLKELRKGRPTRSSLTLSQRGKRPIKITRGGKSPHSEIEICLCPDGALPEGADPTSAMIVKNMTELEMALATLVACPDLFGTEGDDPLDGDWEPYQDDPDCGEGPEDLYLD